MIADVQIGASLACDARITPRRLCFGRWSATKGGAADDRASAANIGGNGDFW